MSDFIYDALFIGAHPDDIEIHAGGTIAKMTAAGKKVMLCDLTLGEMASRGTVEERIVEAQDAADVLKADRKNLKLSDGRLQYEREKVVKAIVQIIRETKPRLVLTHPSGDHHPDHNAAADCVKFACFQSNVLKFDTGQDRHQIGRLYHFITSRKRMPAKPDVIVETTDFHEKKIESLKCYKSQLANKDYEGASTYVSSDQAWRMIDVFAGFVGGLVGKTYGEGYTTESPVLIDDLSNIEDSGV